MTEMAWIEERTRADSTTWRVMWREDGAKQQQTFLSHGEALEFFDAVTATDPASGRPRNRWPRDWIKGQGWAHLIERSDAPTFQCYAERTIKARAKADERTRADYLAMLRRHVFPVIGDKPIDTLTRFDIAQVADRMRAAGRSHKTIANVHHVLSSVLDDAHRKEDPPLVRRNVARGELPKPAEEESDQVDLSPGEFALIAKRIAEEEDRDLAVAMAGTGMRWSEATALQVQDLDLFDTKTLKVRRAWKRRGGLFVLGPPKSRKSRRTLGLSPGLVVLFARRCAGKNPDEFVFTTKQGRPVRHSNWYNRVWQPAVLRARQCDHHAKETPDKPCTCAGVLTKRPTIHSLRHSHLTWLLKGKVTLTAAQGRAGHDSIETTIGVYAHLEGDQADEINAIVDQSLGLTRDTLTV